MSDSMALGGLVEQLTDERDRAVRALGDVLAVVWPDPDTWTPHEPNEECDEFCALMRTLHEARAALTPILFEEPSGEVGR